MTMTASVEDFDGAPLSPDFLIADDSDFADPEAFAKETAANGTKCCIRWHRDEDGQTAYYGPRGVCINPYWYVRMGRPELADDQRTRPRTIWMTDAEWAKVQAAPKGWVRGLVARSKVPACES